MVRLVLKTVVVVELRVVHSLELGVLEQAMMEVVGRHQKACVMWVVGWVASCQLVEGALASDLYLKRLRRVLSLSIHQRWD